MTNPRRSGTLAALLGAICLSPAAAEPLVYTLSVPDGQRVAYSVEIEVEHPGTLVVTADWEGGRVLSFRLQGPGPTIRRSGPSPQRLEVQVDARLAANRRPWLLRVFGLAARGGGEGTMVIEIPEAAEPEPATPPASPPGSSSKPAATDLPPGSPLDWVRFDRTLRRFRDALAEGQLPDACRWQESFAEYLEKRRDDLLEREVLPAPPTHRILAHIAKAIARVEELRSSDDPILAGPVPKDRERLRQWLRSRQEWILSLEQQLDTLQSEVRREHAPELSGEPWPVRMIGCIIACERHFEQRVRYGEERATSLELARAQWDRVLVAAEALDALTALGQGEPATSARAAAVP